MITNELRATRRGWKETVGTFQSEIASRTRREAISQYECAVVEVTDSTPLGCIELHHGHGIGPNWVLVSLLSGRKVAVPVLAGGDYVCRPLTADPMCYGKWYPFSVFADSPDIFVKGHRIGDISSGPVVWKLRCHTRDRTLTWVPIPRHFEDADMRCGSHVRSWN